MKSKNTQPPNDTSASATSAKNASAGNADGNLFDAQKFIGGAGRDAMMHVPLAMRTMRNLARNPSNRARQIH